MCWSRPVSFTERSEDVEEAMCMHPVYSLSCREIVPCQKQLAPDIWIKSPFHKGSCSCMQNDVSMVLSVPSGYIVPYIKQFPTLYNDDFSKVVYFFILHDFLLYFLDGSFHGSVFSCVSLCILCIVPQDGEQSLGKNISLLLHFRDEQRKRWRHSGPGLQNLLLWRDE